MAPKRCTGGARPRPFGKPIFSFTRPEWAAADIDAWRQSLLGDGKLRQVGRRTLKSRREAVIETAYAVVRDPAGEAIGIIGIGRDVTERELGREALAASDARFRTVLASMSEGVIVRNAEGQFLDANDAALRLLGLKAEHLRGEKPMPAGWRSEHADGTPLTIPRVVAALRAGPLEAEGVVDRGDGQRTWLRLRAQPLRSTPQGPITGVVTTLSDISATREAQRIELDRARLAGLEERSNEAEVVMRDGVVVQANDRAMQTYGPLVGRDLASLSAAFSVGTNYPRREDAELRPQRYQTEHRRADGTTFPVEVSTRPFQVAGETSVHLLMRDLTESRREAQQQRLLAGLIREMSDAVLVTDLGLRITEYTGASDRIYGWTREEALGKHLPTDVVTEFPDGDRDRFEAALAQGKTARVTMHAQRKDGSWVDLDASYSPLRDERGTLTAWLSVARDVTLELAAKRALEAREAQLEYVIDGSTDGSFDADLARATTTFSRRWAELFGYGLAEFVAPGNWFETRCEPQDYQQLVRAIERHAAAEDRSFEEEVRVRHADDVLRWALVRGKIVERDAAGVPTRIAGTWTDVNARHEAEVARQAALLENERLVGELRAALQNVKTPHRAAADLHGLQEDPRRPGLLGAHRSLRRRAHRRALHPWPVPDLLRDAHGPRRLRCRRPRRFVRARAPAQSDRRQRYPTPRACRRCAPPPRDP
jgi:PAS domain S-box-containing protein